MRVRVDLGPRDYHYLPDPRVCHHLWTYPASETPLTRVCWLCLTTEQRPWPTAPWICRRRPEPDLTLDAALAAALERI